MFLVYTLIEKFLREESFANEIYPQKFIFAGTYFCGRKENYAENYFRGYY